MDILERRCLIGMGGGAHRAIEVVQDLSRYGAEQEATIHAKTMGRHHDEIRSPFVRDLYDFFGGISDEAFFFRVEVAELVGQEAIELLLADGKKFVGEDPLT